MMVSCDLRHRSTWRSVSCTAVMWCRRMSVNLTTFNQDEAQRSSNAGSLPVHLLHALQLHTDRLSGEAHHEKLSVMETTMSVCEHATMMVNCYPRH